jgi:phosphate starvation-inducible PhoH-like protein
MGSGRKSQAQPRNREGLSLRPVQPMTPTQSKVWESYDEGNNLLLTGSAGTGKSFVSMYLALDEVYNDHETERDRLVIVRSAVPTRDLGFLPGDDGEKLEVYLPPYIDMAAELFEHGGAFGLLRRTGKLEFKSTSFLRGGKIDRAVILVDEIQNMTFQELDTVITRVGPSSRIIFSGDFGQSDLLHAKDREGLAEFVRILDTMAEFDHVNFTVDDVVRSGLVKSYLVAKERNAQTVRP